MRMVAFSLKYSDFPHKKTNRERIGIAIKKLGTGIEFGIGIGIGIEIENV